MPSTAVPPGDSGAASTVVELVKAKVTGGEARPGDHDTVEF